MSLGLHLAKIRLSERKTKYIWVFPSGSTLDRQVKGTIKRAKSKRKSQIFFVSIFATKLQRYFSFHTSSLKSDADIICPEGCCAGRSWWFAGVPEFVCHPVYRCFRVSGRLADQEISSASWWQLATFYEPPAWLVWWTIWYQEYQRHWY